MTLTRSSTTSKDPGRRLLTSPHNALMSHVATSRKPSPRTHRNPMPRWRTMATIPATSLRHLEYVVEIALHLEKEAGGGPDEEDSLDQIGGPRGAESCGQDVLDNPCYLRSGHRLDPVDDLCWASA